MLTFELYLGISANEYWLSIATKGLQIINNNIIHTQLIKDKKQRVGLGKVLSFIGYTGCKLL